jgi:hydroxypyruvate isomerase
MKLAANVSTLFMELPLIERFQAAVDAGFQGVEAQRPYEASADAIANELARLSLPLVLFNIPAPIAALPDHRDAFLSQFDEALTYARATQCKQLHVQPGVIPPEVSHAEAEETFIDNLRYAADAAAADGINILMEPINDKVDMPGYFYSTSAEVLRIMDLVAKPNLRLQYDIYHMQIMEGDLARTIERLLPRIGHMQLADNPGRGEPGTGEINYPWLLNKIDELGYDGWMGCEYFPVAGTAAGLGWTRPYLR